MVRCGPVIIPSIEQHIALTLMRAHLEVTMKKFKRNYFEVFLGLSLRCEIQICIDKAHPSVDFSPAR
jgi:hypothetical protein